MKAKTITGLTTVLLLVMVAFSAIPISAATTSTTIENPSWEKSDTSFPDTSIGQTALPPTDASWTWGTAWDGPSQSGPPDNTPIPLYHDDYWAYLVYPGSACPLPTTSPQIHQWLKTTLTLPSLTGITKIELLDYYPQTSPTNIPKITINDNLFAFVNPASFTLDDIDAYGGTSQVVGGFPGALTSRIPPPTAHGVDWTNAPETGWWIDPLELPLGDFVAGDNTVYVLLEEFCYWGGLGHLAFQVTTTTYDVTVNAKENDNALAGVPIVYSYDGTGPTTGNTEFSLSILSGSTLSLDAPPTYVDPSYTFYAFTGWTYPDDICTPNPSDSSIITCAVDSDFMATAHYTKILSVDKILVACSFSGGFGDVCDPKSLPLNTKVYFHMLITFHAYTELVTGVTVKDGIGADLVFQYATPSGPTSTSVSSAKAGTGKMGATVVTWSIGDPLVSEDYILDLYAYTGVNPKLKQEYTSTGTHYLNSGPVVYFTYDNVRYMLYGPGVSVYVPPVV